MAIHPSMRRRARSRMGQKQVDLFRFFVERAHAESRLFYTRNAVFAGFQVIALRYVLDYFLRAPALQAASGSPIPLGIALAGVFVSAMWFFVNRQSLLYNEVWLRDADRLVRKDAFLRSRVVDSLQTPGLEKSAHSKLVRLRTLLSFWTWTAGDWFQSLVVVTAIGWVALAMLLT